jgi:predicted outer membrane repeat protein
MKLTLLGAAAAFVISIAGASAQPVTPATDCAAIATVNPRFLANVMMMAIQQRSNFIDGYVAFLNEFAYSDRSGDQGVEAAEQLHRATASIGGGGESTSEAERIDRANRAGAEAASLMPTLTGACAANPGQPLLYVVQVVLYRAGYGSAPAAPGYAPPPTPHPAPAGTNAQPVTPSTAGSGRAIGPSFDCNTERAPLAQFICTSPDLSRADLEFVQAYYALRQQVGPAGWQALKREDIDFQHRTDVRCGIAPSGALPPDTAALAACLRLGYTMQRSIWLSRLSGAALEEARRPVEQHVALQRDLQWLGFLPPTATVDGVFGGATRSAILTWQQSKGMPVTGFLGDQDAQALAEQPGNNNPSSLPSRSDIGSRSCNAIIGASQEALIPIAGEEIQYMERRYPDLTIQRAMTETDAKDIGAFVKAKCDQPGEQDAPLASVLDAAAGLMRGDQLKAWLDQHQSSPAAAARTQQAAAADQASLAATPATSGALDPCRAIMDDAARLKCYDTKAVAGAGTGDAQDHSQSIMAVSEWTTYWVIGEPAMDLSPMCVPAVRFRITNTSDHALDAVELSASFLDNSAKTVFGGAITFWSATAGKPPLPPGFSRDTELRATHGFKYVPGSCTADNLLDLTVRAQAKMILDFDSAPIPLGEGSVDRNQSVFFDPATQSGAIHAAPRRAGPLTWRDEDVR